MTGAILACVCLIQAALWSNGEAYTVSGLPSKSGNFIKGETFTLQCTGTSTEEENLTPLFLKTMVEIQTSSGPAIMDDKSVFPYAVATGSTIDAKIESDEPGRYTATGSHDATSFDYTYTITNLKAQDSGNYSCGVKQGPNQETAPSNNIPVLVLEKISKLAIVYQKHGEKRDDLGNNPGIDDNDGRLTYQLEDPAGELACMVQSSTSLPYDCKMMLYDPFTKEDVDVTDKFDTKYSSPKSIPNAPFLTNEDKDYFISASPKPGAPNRFGNEDSGKTLKFTCKSTGFDDVSEVSTVLDIQYSPRTPTCNGIPQGPVGHKNFTMLCYTRSNPDSEVTWMANDAELRDGINVQTRNEGAYKVSTMIIDELQESDFTTYKFTATNKFGISSSDPAWEIKKGEEVRMASTDPSDYPWGPKKETPNKSNSASMMLASTFSLTLIALLVLFI